MLNMLREDELATEFCKLRETSSQIAIAVPFWGEGAIASLNLRGSPNTRIICNLASNACNP
jgi:hypothetical protein